MKPPLNRPEESDHTRTPGHRRWCWGGVDAADSFYCTQRLCRRAWADEDAVYEFMMKKMSSLLYSKVSSCRVGTFAMNRRTILSDLAPKTTLWRVDLWQLIWNKRWFRKKLDSSRKYALGPIDLWSICSKKSCFFDTTWVSKLAATDPQVMSQVQSTIFTKGLWYDNNDCAKSSCKKMKIKNSVSN